MSRYRLFVEDQTRQSQATEFVVKGKSPAKALRELVTEAKMELATQDGRYGRLTDGRGVMALTEAWGRVDGPEARTTRLLGGKELR